MPASSTTQHSIRNQFPHSSATAGSGTDQSTHNGFSHISNEEQWPGIDSRYRLIVVAALRSKQLLRGASPRIDADPMKRRNTSIALEEVKRGLVSFTVTTEEQKSDGQSKETEAEGLQ